MKDLLLVVPSRGRLGSIQRLAEAMDETCTADTGLMVGIDADDPLQDQYFDLNQDLDMGIGFVRKPGIRYVVPWVNQLAVMFSGQYRHIGHVGDDNIPRTTGWDERIIAALDDKTPFAFGNDLYPRAPGSLCCHVFMRGDVVTRLGYFGPPQIKHMYVDVAWMAWGLACGISYLDDVIIEHLHFTTGKSPPDELYVRSQALIPEDLGNWHAYSRNPEGLNADIAKLGGTPYTPESLAAFNANLFVPG